MRTTFVRNAVYMSAVIDEVTMRTCEAVTDKYNGIRLHLREILIQFNANKLFNNLSARKNY